MTTRWAFRVRRVLRPEFIGDWVIIHATSASAAARLAIFQSVDVLERAVSGGDSRVEVQAPDSVRIRVFQVVYDIRMEATEV